MRWEPGQLGFKKFIQTVIEKMWSKLCDYYSNTERPLAFIDSTLLHPTLKVSFMKKAKYSDDDITNYKREGEQRYHRSYNSSVPVIVPSIPRGKRPRPLSSDSESSGGEDINEFTNYLATKRDKSVKDQLAWWFKSQSIFPKLSKMACDVYAVPATGAGVEREFSISGRVITKQCNRLSPSTIRDLMQYKRWVARYGSIWVDLVDQKKAAEGASEVDDTDGDPLPDYDQEEDNSQIVEWLKAWEKKERVSQRIRRLGTM